MTGQVRIGISGWTYPPWRGVWYPKGLPHARELSYAAGVFNSIEINGSFYSLQTPSSYRKWSAAAPDGFVFAVEGGRYITHMRKLRDVKTPLANFFASGILLLGEKLGPILWQFPPNLGFDEDRFEEFFSMLPRTTKQAAALARRHDAKVGGRSWTRAGVDRPIRHAVEIRHRSFLDERFIAMLRRHGIALVIADTAGSFPYAEDVTADFIYIRLHGSTELYASGYSDEELDRWAKRVRQWRRGREPADAVRVSTRRAPARRSRDVYVYFDNDAKVKAPFDAMRLAERVGS